MYLRCDGAVAETPPKLPITDFIKREHFEAEHNVANAIIHCFSMFTNWHQPKIQFLVFFFFCVHEMFALAINVHAKH